MHLQELSPHTAPLFVSAVRLLPAGLALIAWAAASGRPQPKSGAAWLAISIFGLADATCFQASTPALLCWTQQLQMTPFFRYCLMLVVRLSLLAHAGLPGRGAAAHSSRAWQRHHRLPASVRGSARCHILWGATDRSFSSRAPGGRCRAVSAGAAPRGASIFAPDPAG